MWARHRHEHIADVLRYSSAFYSSCFELYGFFFKTFLSNVNVIAPFWIIFVQNGGLRVNLSIWFLVLFFTVRMRDKRHFWNLPVRSSIWTVHVLSLVPFFSLTDNYWRASYHDTIWYWDYLNHFVICWKPLLLFIGRSIHKLKILQQTRKFPLLTRYHVRFCLIWIVLLETKKNLGLSLYCSHLENLASFWFS